MRGVEALGGDASKIDVLIYQFVTLVRGGEPVKMSTRKANFVTLDDLVDEVGPDVVRFFFLMLSPGTHLNFDLDLAKEAGEKNPVFYLQYAHARIRSIERKAEEVGVEVTDSPDWELLGHESETALMKELLRLPEQIALGGGGDGAAPAGDVPPRRGDGVQPVLPRLPHRRRGADARGGAARPCPRHADRARQRAGGARHLGAGADVGVDPRVRPFASLNAGTHAGVPLRHDP